MKGSHSWKGRQRVVRYCWLSCLVVLCLSELGGGFVLADPETTAALHKAARENDCGQIMRLMGRAGTGDDSDARDERGVRPLHVAAALNHTEATALLVSYGARMDARTDGGFTPLHWAATKNALNTTRLLLQMGADVNSKTPTGVTPLHCAAKNNCVALAQLLMEKGADRMAKTESGMTPLHYALMRDAKDMSALLALRSVVDEVAPAGGREAAAMYEKALARDFGVVPDLSPADPLVEVSMAGVPIDSVAADMVAASGSGGVVATDSPEKGLATGQAGGSDSRIPERTPSDGGGLSGARFPADAADNGGSVAQAAERTAASEFVAEVASRWNKADGEERVPRTNDLLVLDIGSGEKLVLVYMRGLDVYFGKYEITNAQYRRFKQEHNSLFRDDFSLNSEQQPVVYVSWEDAMAFCDWLTLGFSASLPPAFGFRLPSSEEWKTVARCGRQRVYPWGNELPPQWGNYSDETAAKFMTMWKGFTGYKDGWVVSCPVTQAGANEWGLVGLGGNVWEWCDDWLDERKTYKIRRGASWDFDKADDLKIEAYGIDKPDVRDDTVGFRVVAARLVVMPEEGRRLR